MSSVRFARRRRSRGGATASEKGLPLFASARPTKSLCRRPLSTGRLYCRSQAVAPAKIYTSRCHNLSPDSGTLASERVAAPRGRGIPTSLRTFKSIFALPLAEALNCVERTTRISLPGSAGLRLPFLGQIVASEPVAASRAHFKRCCRRSLMLVGG